MIDVKDIYWAAGIMEGEGWFGHSKNNGIKKGICASLEMTDKDTIDKFSSIFDFGTRSVRLLPSGKTSYKWSVTNQRKAVGFMMTLYSLMSIRRKEKITEIIDSWKLRPLPKKQWTHCKHGHKLSGDNLRITYEGKYMKRICLACSKIRTQKYRDKLRLSLQQINVD